MLKIKNKVQEQEQISHIVQMRTYCCIQSIYARKIWKHLTWSEIDNNI